MAANRNRIISPQISAIAPKASVRQRPVGLPFELVRDLRLTLTTATGYRSLHPLLPYRLTRPGPRRAAPQTNGSPAHYFSRPKGKLGPALNLLGGHPRAAARLRSLYVLAEAGPRRGPALELAKFPSENNMIWRLRRPLAAYNVVAALA
jgi:hypothetical protein